MPEFNLSPINLVDYAKSLGWHMVDEALPDRLYVFDHPDFSLRQLVFPMDDSAPDFVEAAERTIQKISALHRISIPSILNAIPTVRDDSLRLRITTDRNNSQSLPLELTVSLLDGVKKLLLAAAHTVIKPQRHHLRLGGAEAHKLLNHTRFGQTEPGSFVMRVSCPVRALDIPSAWVFDEVDLPFVRKTTLTIKRSVRQLIQAVEADRLDQLVERIKKDDAPMISSNLCEAVLMLHQEDFGNNVDFSYNWAFDVPLPAGEDPHEVVSIRNTYFSRIEEVRRELRPVEHPAVDTFIGTVEELAGDMGSEGQREGEVSINLLLHEGKTVRAKVVLDAANYDQAIKAHRTNDAYIQITGKLHPGPNPRLLTDITQFSLLQPNAG